MPTHTEGVVRAAGRHLVSTVTLAMVFAIPVAAVAQGGDEPPQRVDFLTFAQGAIPLSVGGAGPDHGAGFEHAVAVIDGNPGGFSMLNRSTAETDVEFLYSLPAETTFDRLAIPNVLETPSPSQTFFEKTKISGTMRCSVSV